MNSKLSRKSREKPKKPSNFKDIISSNSIINNTTTNSSLTKDLQNNPSNQLNSLRNNMVAKSTNQKRK
jgi:hypothetical protein